MFIMKKCPAEFLNGESLFRRHRGSLSAEVFKLQFLQRVHQLSFHTVIMQAESFISMQSVTEELEKY